MASSEYRLPAPPAGSPDLTLLRWLRRPGDTLAPGDPLVIVANDRFELALPAEAPGVLAEQLFPAGTAVPAGAPIARLAPAPEALPPAPLGETPDRRSAAEPPATRPDRPISQREPAIEPPRPPRRITPVARRVAAERAVGLAEIVGSGVSGWITKADVLAALVPAPPVAAAAVAPAGLVLHLPAGNVPHALTAIEVDLTGVAAERERLSGNPRWRGLAVPESLWPLAAAAAILPAHPLLNSSWHDTGILLRRRVDLVLVESGRRVLVPGAQDLNLRGIARALAAGSPPGTGCGTFTVIAYAPPVWCGMPELPAGQAAALGFGATHLQPVVVVERGSERVAARRISLLTLVYDARVIDQARADAFLRAMKAWIERADTFAQGI
jgi:pyruvate/2-oxoglutarate dehydrogenase complex dihydrolipoamide acyltransferase (E2) component